MFALFAIYSLISHSSDRLLYLQELGSPHIGVQFVYFLPQDHTNLAFASLACIFMSAGENNDHELLSSLLHLIDFGFA